MSLSEKQRRVLSVAVEWDIIIAALVIIALGKNVIAWFAKNRNALFMYVIVSRAVVRNMRTTANVVIAGALRRDTMRAYAN